MIYLLMQIYQPQKHNSTSQTEESPCMLFMCLSSLLHNPHFSCILLQKYIEVIVYFISVIIFPPVTICFMCSLSFPYSPFSCLLRFISHSDHN